MGGDGGRSQLRDRVRLPLDIEIELHTNGPSKLSESLVGHPSELPYQPGDRDWLDLLEVESSRFEEP